MHVIAGLIGATVIALGLFGLNTEYFGGGTGTLNQLTQWEVSGGNIKLASSTASIRIPFLTNCDTIDTDANGIASCGTDAGGGASGFSTTSNDFWKTVRNFFSTSSADYWETTQAARGGSGSGFSTTSADYWKTQRSFFSTTSTDYWKTLTSFFSTTSQDYWNSQYRDLQIVNGNLAPTTTIGLILNASSSITRLSTILSTTSQATTTNLYVSGLLSFASTVGNSWDDFCVAITGGSGLCDGVDATGAGGSAAVATSTNETAGRLSYWTSTSGTPATLGEVATTSLTATAPLSLSQPISVLGSLASALSISTAGDWTGTFDGQEGATYLANSFSTTSANVWQGTRNFFSTTSADYLATQRSYFSTTSNDYWKTQNNFFSTTSADYLASQRNFFSTTSAIYFADASTTIPKTYTANAFTGLQSFTAGASTSALTVSNLNSASCDVKASATGVLSCGTDATGGGGSGGGPFSTSTNSQLVYNNAGRALLFTDNQRTATSTDSVLEIERDAATTTITLALTAINPEYRAGLRFTEGGTLSASWLYDGSGSGRANRIGFTDEATGSGVMNFSIYRDGGFVASASSTIPSLSTMHSTTTNATSTNLFSTQAVFTNATTTSLSVSNLSAGSCDVKATNGVLSCGTDATSAGGANDFTFATTYSTLSAATTSSLFLQSPAKLFASSTAYFSDAIHLAAIAGTATSTILSDLQIGSAIGDNKVRITADRVFSASNSVGGLLNLTNTSNTGPALVAYTNNGGTSAGNLVNVRCDNATMAHDCFKVDYDGTGDGLAIAATAAASNALSLSNTGVDHTLNVAYTGSTAQKGAMNLSSTNTSGSVFQIAGAPVALGVGKITHNGTGDADSSILSLDASTAGYLGQGIFLDSSGGTWGTGLKMLNLRANGTERLTLTTDGLLTISNGIITNASSTIPRLSTTSSTSTNATSTNLFSTQINATNSTTTSLAVSNLSAGSCDVKALGGVLYCGTDATGTGGGASPFDYTTYGLSPANATSSLIGFTNGLYATASSTIASLFTNFSTSTNATSTNLFATQLNTTNATASMLSAITATFTNATTTSLAVTNVTSSLLKTNATGGLVAAIAGTDYANFSYLFPSNATTSILSFTNGLIAGSSTITRFDTIFGTTTNATSTNLFATRGNFTSATTTYLSATGGIFTNATTTSLTVSNLSAGSCDVKATNGVLSCGTDATGGAGGLKLPTYTVDADGAGDYTTIQAALDACVNGGKIYLTDPAYTISSTLTFKGSGCEIIGNAGSTTISLNGASVTTAIKTNSAAAGYSRNAIRDVIFSQTNATYQGTGIDASDMALNTYENVRLLGFGKAIVLDDTQNITFYNTFSRVNVFNTATSTTGYGVYASSTNPANHNYFNDTRIAVNTGGTCMLFNNVQGIQLTNPNCEPATISDTTGLSLQKSGNTNTIDVTVTNIWAEGNATGASIGSGVRGTNFIGGQITANTTNLSDSGIDTVLLNTNINSTRSTALSPLKIIQHGFNTAALFIQNNTNFAHNALDYVKFSLLNASDSSNLLNLNNAGTGYTIVSTTSAFYLTANGRVGIGSSTPSALLSVSSLAYNGITDLFAISTSSHKTGGILGLYATSTSLFESGTRFTIGASSANGYYDGPTLDTLNINGPYNTGDWINEQCSTAASETSQIAGDTQKTCGRWTTVEDTAGVQDFAATAGESYFRFRAGAAGTTNTAGDGMGFMFNSPFLTNATNTPIFETVARIGVVGSATGTTIQLGFVDESGVATDFASVSLTGCFFSSGNLGSQFWETRCGNGGAATNKSTTFATSSSFTNTGGWFKFRIEMSSTSAKFYMASSTGPASFPVMKLVSVHNASTEAFPTRSQLLNAVTTIGRPAAAGPTQPELHIKYIRLWYKDWFY